MKKFLMAVIALIMTVGVVSAQKCMYVWMKDGTHLSIPVSSFDSVGFYAPTYTLSVTTEGEGSVTGAGAYKIDTEVTLTATAASGYTFSQWSDGKTDNPRIIKMERDLTLTAVFTAVGGGATGGIGLFSVSATQQVTFAPGNLQYQASTDTWRFAEHQWDIVGMGYGQTNTDIWCYIGGTVQNSDNRNISSSYSGWIDLFGWGTGNAPTKSSTNSSDYPTFVDWGTNAISNGGNQANMWRTMTNDEWNYLFSGRANASSKYGVGMVNGINGMIVLPDEFTLPSGLTFNAGVASSSGYQYYQTKNNYSAAEWARMEACGALFLPAAGYRYGSSVHSVGYYGGFWSSTPHGTDYDYACNRDFRSDYSYWYYYNRNYGRSVRLVRAAQGEQEPIIYRLSVSVEGEGTVTGAGEYKSGTTVTLTATAASGYTFSQWSDGVTDNPRTITMTQNLTLTAVFTAVGGGSTGGIGLFSVSATKQVTFSKGNLQYQASTNTWRFAEHQYDNIGEANKNISSTYSGWIDMFGWGTGNTPTKTSIVLSAYGTFMDWGMNPISNGGNEAGLWRTLASAEWVYLFNSRQNNAKLYGMGTIAGISGVILLPDNWVKPSGVSFWSYSEGNADDHFSDNTYTVSQWQKMEDAGAVFLPAAGSRVELSVGNTVSNTGSRGYYWSSTQYGSDNAYELDFSTSFLNLQGYSNRCYGFSVRLVQVLMN